MKMLHSLRSAAFGVCILLSAAPDATYGLTKVWDGSGNGNLSNPVNWVGGIAPVNGDSLVFPASGVIRFNVTNNFLGGPRFRSMTFEGNGFALYGAFMVLSNGIGAENLAGVNRVNCAIQLAANQTFFINGDTGALLDINGDVALGAHSLTVSAGGGDLFLGGVLSGTGGISKISGGRVRFDGSAANTYTGPTTVIGGTLELFKGPTMTLAVPGDLILGAAGAVNSDVVRLLRNNQIAPDATVTIGQAGLLDLNAFANTIGALSMNGGRVAGGTLTLDGDVTATSVVGSIATISGTLALGAASRTFTVADNASTDPDLNIDAAISGAPGVIKAGAGTLAFSGSASNSYTGGTRVTEGTLLLRRSFFDRSIAGNLIIGDGAGPAFSDVVRIENFAQINNSSAVIILPSGLLDLNGISETIGSLQGEGRVDVGPNNLGVGGNGASTTYSGEIIGSGALTKTGLGAMTLTGTNSNTGTTLVVAGTLLVNGQQRRSPVNVTGGTLGGTGVVGNITASGNIAPGLSPGSLACSNFNLSVGGDLFIELNGVLPGSGYDQMVVFGGVTLNSPTLHVSVGSPPFDGQRFTIILQDGNDPVNGTFMGLPHASVLTVNDRQFHVSYQGGAGGNAVELVVTNNPLWLAFPTIVNGGNLNGRVDPNECNLFSVVLTNRDAAPVSGIRATLLPNSDGWSATQPFSTYPDLAPNARGTNETPFQISLLPGWVCGSSFVFEMIIETTSHGAFRISLGSSTGLPGAPLRFDNNVPMAIPDLSTADSTINVSGVATAIERVNVSLHIAHPSAQDLDISLINPLGVAINLSSDNGGASANYGTNCFDHQRTTFSDFPVSNPLIAATSAPFVGTFRPETALSAFLRDFGPEVNGPWTLRVTDDTGGNVGTLQCWSLIITPYVCADGGGPCESCPDRTILGSITPRSAVQVGRVSPNAPAGACAAPQPCPGISDVGLPRFYDAYTFENGESNACITVTLDAPCSLFSAAYSDSYNPGSLCDDYLAAAAQATDGAPRIYSFTVAARARFVVVVNQIDAADLCDYRLDVTGGSCRPVLHISRGKAPLLVDLDWTTAAVGYQLEITNALSDPSAPQWLPIMTAPVTIDSRLRISNLALPDDTRFYRLRKP